MAKAVYNDGMLDRSRFLDQNWHRYPVAPQPAFDVSQYLRQSSVLNSSCVVCGRVIAVGPKAIEIESNGAKAQFRWSSDVGWMAPQPAQPRFECDVLRVADTVALGLAHGLIAEVLLLTPAPAISRESTRGPRLDVLLSRQWMQMTEAIRAYFKSSDFIEALTPTLVPSPGTEPYLDAFSTEWSMGSKRHTLFLPTSPEFHLKKMLVRGWTRIFELKTCFRNGEVGTHHQPEFTMLEWYRAYDTLESIARDCEALFAACAESMGLKRPAKLQRASIADLFAHAFRGFQLKPQTTRAELATLAESHSVAVAVDDSFDDIYFRLFLEKIEPTLGLEQPILVYGYPPSQAALARLRPDGFADRFEIYWRGLEIANAFHELNDPIENAARFRADAETKARLGRAPVPVDDELIEELYRGLPPSGGIALGVDRLFMALTGVSEITATRAFPFRETEMR